MIEAKRDLYGRHPELCVCRDGIDKTCELIEGAYRNGGKLLLCGNGGSCADCDHIAGELLKGFLKKRPMGKELRSSFERLFPDEADGFTSTLQCGLSAVSLHSQTAALTAFANDVDPSMIYAQMVFALAKPDDIVMGISTSGNSRNVINALKTAKAMGLCTVALTGEKKCLADDVCDAIIKVPASDTYKIQEYHLPVYHEICARLEEVFFTE